MKIVIDKQTGMPVCAMLQAVYGGEMHLEIAIPGELWQLTPPAQPVIVDGTREQWREWSNRKMEERK